MLKNTFFNMFHFRHFTILLIFMFCHNTVYAHANKPLHPAWKMIEKWPHDGTECEWSEFAFETCIPMNEKALNIIY